MIIIPDITNPFYTVFARGVQDALRKQGYHTVLCNTDAIESEERDYLGEAIARRLDGVIIGAFHVGHEALAPLSAAGIAVVSLGVGKVEGQVDRVGFDQVAFARDAVEHLLDRVSGPIAFIDGDEGSPPSRARRLGFLAACESRGRDFPPDYVVSADFTIDGGAQGMAKLLDLDAPPRGVFCANDLIALGAMRVAKERGLRIPEDLAVIGCDDIDAAALVTPPLTTVRQDADRLGRECGAMLLSRMSGAYQGPGRSLILPHELIVRGSA
ncbi:MAG TPA: substrate-binding domain-containing protein [Devosia sp.]|nr:substrate-binding domain-containing protein [Devosia sp.]